MTAPRADLREQIRAVVGNYCRHYDDGAGTCECDELAEALALVLGPPRLEEKDELLASLMTLVSDPHLTWPEARARLTALLNTALRPSVQPGFERCPECGNLAMNPLPSCSTCGNGDPAVLGPQPEEKEPDLYLTHRDYCPACGRHYLAANEIKDVTDRYPPGRFRNRVIAALKPAALGHAGSDKETK